MKERLVELHRKAFEHLLETGESFSHENYADFLLANGVIALPCKVGDAIYQTDGTRIYESTVMEITYTTNKVIYCTENICFDETAIDKSIFLTKEEAEKHLKG